MRAEILELPIQNWPYDHCSSTLAQGPISTSHRLKYDATTTSKCQELDGAPSQVGARKGCNRFEPTKEDRPPDYTNRIPLMRPIGNLHQRALHDQESEPYGDRFGQKGQRHLQPP